MVIPNRSYGNRNPEEYKFHASSAVIGFRKYRAFDTKNLMIGLEYARLVQGSYYNILPTPNWYDNINTTMRLTMKEDGAHILVQIQTICWYLWG